MFIVVTISSEEKDYHPYTPFNSLMNSFTAMWRTSHLNNQLLDGFPWKISNQQCKHGLDFHNKRRGEMHRKTSQIQIFLEHILI